MFDRYRHSEQLLQGIYKHAGEIRNFNITKKWVLDGASVIYGNASELDATLEYEFLQIMHGISEMPLSAQIIQTWRMGSMKQRSILRRFLEICL